jgi:hypothetical protein
MHVASYCQYTFASRTLGFRRRFTALVITASFHKSSKLLVKRAFPFILVKAPTVGLQYIALTPRGSFGLLSKREKPELSITELMREGFRSAILLLRSQRNSKYPHQVARPPRQQSILGYSPTSWGSTILLRASGRGRRLAGPPSRRAFSPIWTPTIFRAPDS